VLKTYLSDEEAIESDEDLDDRRITIINRIGPLITAYQSVQLDLGVYKTQIDSISKTRRGNRDEVGDLWGFKGIKGMMFFNLLHTACELHNINLDELLKPAIQLPSSRDEAYKQMKFFYDKVSEIQGEYEDRRKAPNPRSVPYFLTYFWQIQNPEVWPIQYTSMERAFEMLGIWTATDNIVADYESFLNLMNELVDVFSEHAKRPFNLWQVEHVFWYYYNNESYTVSQSEVTLVSEAEADSVTDIGEVSAAAYAVLESLPKSYVPSVVSILPGLARKDPDLEKLCEDENKSISKELENRVADAFVMLGFEVEKLGQGRGRVPDGIAMCREYHYAIIYDAKATQYDYSIGTDSRAFTEYIRSQTPRLRRQGIEKIFFAIVSGSFSDSMDQEIERIKMTPGVQEVVLLPAESIVKLVEVKLRTHDFDLGYSGLLSMLTRGGILLKQDIDE
jgi:hypothetical protein